MRDVASGANKDKHWGLIYGGGLFAGICQDVAIRRATGNKRSLDDLMRDFFKRYGGSNDTYTTEDLERAVTGLSSIDHRSFYSRYIEGNERLPLAECLRDAGLDARIEKGSLVLGERTNLSPADSDILNGVLGLSAGRRRQ
jgi:predicted metalloprotease with PDZ domain